MMPPMKVEFYQPVGRNRYPLGSGPAVARAGQPLPRTAMRSRQILSDWNGRCGIANVNHRIIPIR